MSAKTNKVIYWAATGLLCSLMLLSVGLYLFTYDRMVDIYVRLGYPAYLIYPSAIAKLLGVAAILSRKSKTLKEWAYAGFFFDLTLAFFAHLMAGDGGGGLATIGWFALVVSYGFDRKLSAESKSP